MPTACFLTRDMVLTTPSMRLAVFVWACLSLTSRSDEPRQNNATPDAGPVDKLCAYVNGMRTARLALDTEMYVTSPGKPRRLFNHESDRVFFDRGGRRIRVLKQELSNSTHKPLLQTEQLYTLTQYLHVSADVSTNKARAASSRLSLAAAHWDSFASNSYY